MNWRRMRLRGDIVLARCDDAGNLVVDGGKVEIRYKPDGKPYHALARNLLDAGEHGANGEAKSRPRGERRDARGDKAPPVAAVLGRHHKAIEPFATGKVIAYADGACSGNPGPAGSGVVLFANGKRYELSEYLGRGTNNIGELTAILRAAEATDPSATLAVHTDSQYAIGVLSGRMRAKANRDLIADAKSALARLAHHSLHYVPGHAGHEWNERADRLAVQAVELHHSQDWTEACD